jgi:hypothetical protein
MAEEFKAEPPGLHGFSDQLDDLALRIARWRPG